MLNYTGIGISVSVIFLACSWVYVFIYWTQSKRKMCCSIGTKLYYILPSTYWVCISNERGT